MDAPDASDLQATLMNGATCSPYGVSFDGVDDYVDIDDWEWGGALTIEVSVRFESFHPWSRVLEFSNGNDDDNRIFLSTTGSDNINWGVVPGKQVEISR